MKVAISSAEVSGDLLGAELVCALKAQNSNIIIEGLVGEKMQCAGAKQLWDMHRVNVMGFSAVLKKIPWLIRLRHNIIKYVRNHKPDVFIGVDAPDFNLKIERKLKLRGIKTVHFVSPSVWAWRASRVKKIKQSADLMLCLFPFEVDFYQKHQQKACFVGHPLAQRLKPRSNHIQSENVLLMPGSRKDEVTRLLPEMLAASKIMHANNPALKYHIVLANDNCLDWVNTQVAKIGSVVNISVGDANTHMLRADLAITASGTAALELALIGVPMVVVYKMSYLSYFIASQLLNSQYISLPNVIANQQLVPELVQSAANASNIAGHALNILASNNSKLIKAFATIHAQLDLNASTEAAKIITEFVHE